MDRQINQALATKLSALRRLAQHLGMFNCQKRPDSKYHHVVYAIIAAMLDESRLPVQRAACATLLDCFFPDWRKDAPTEVLGWIVSRDNQAVRTWRKAVLEADGNACKHCGAVENLHAHHIVPWAEAPHLRVEPSNGITLCRTCHYAEHGMVLA